MNIALLSTRYDVKKVSEEEISDVVNLCEGNPIYYQYCPPLVSASTIAADMLAIPPNKTYEDKFYIGFYQNNKLNAVIDLISQYPNAQTAYIGFFMMDKDMQGRGIGTVIIAECLQYLKSIGYQKVKLGYVKDNPQAKAFWMKNQFLPTGAEDIQENYTVVIMDKEI